MVEENQATIEILDCYEDVFNDTKADVYLLWGGRDKGASQLIAQRFVLDMLQDDYFRGVLIRKTYESIRDSQYQTIKDVVEGANMEHLFTFLKSPLEIICNQNGNKIIARGCDNPGKIKSLKDPNAVHIEEADQLNEQDYITIHTTLRHHSARIRQWLSFNSDFKGDYREHFIWNYYLNNIEHTYKTGMYETEIEVPIADAGGETQIQTIRFYSHHGTYHQNPYCPPKRRAHYESLKNQSVYYYNVYAKGILGAKENDNPWAWALNKKKHYTTEVYKLNPNYTLDLSFDFNADPSTVIVGQIEHHLPRYNIIGAHRASSGDKSALEALCDIIKKEYEPHISRGNYIVTGDATGKSSDASRPSNINRYTEICQYLNIGRSAVMLERANIAHKSSRDLVNDVLFKIQKGGFVFWSGRGCEMLITDIENAYPDDKESLNKYKKEAGGHMLDGFRYLLKMWFAHRMNGAGFKEYQNNIDGVVLRLKTKKVSSDADY